MRTQFIQIGRYGNLLLFLFLEIVAFYLVINYNQKQRSIFLHSSSYYVAEINNQFKKVSNYMHLGEINDSLAHSIANLRNTLPNTYSIFAEFDSTVVIDSVKMYTYTSAQVLSYTTSLRDNSMLINKGKTNGLTGGMAVVGEKGIIGITRLCTEHFCSVILIIHSKSIISARVMPCNCIGNLRWISDNPNILYLSAIPKHAEVNVGDSVYTSGFSHLFPSGILIGTIMDVTLPEGSNFYEISVKTVNDFYSLHYVYVVKNLMHAELDSLMKNEINEG